MPLPPTKLRADTSRGECVGFGTVTGESRPSTSLSEGFAAEPDSRDNLMQVIAWHVFLSLTAVVAFTSRSGPECCCKRAFFGESAVRTKRRLVRCGLLSPQFFFPQLEE